MKVRFTLLLLLYSTFTFAQADSAQFIKINFLYGSRPLRAFRATEPKYFGGLHGGHVTIQVGDLDCGFRKTSAHTHVFPAKKRASAFMPRALNGKSRYSADRKTVTFIIPVTPEQLRLLEQILQKYIDSTPYDYAFFGMRCASATQEILGKIGVLKDRTRSWHLATAFYPKRFRKRVFRLAKEHHYAVLKTEGRPTRRWERD